MENEIPKAAETPVIDLNAFIDIFESPGHACHFVDRVTGKIIVANEGDWANLEIPSNYVKIPESGEVDEFRLMRDFCRSLKDANMQEALLYTMQGKGAFRRFKAAISFHKIENLWDRFRHQRLKQFAMLWCKENKLIYTYSPKSGS